MTINGEMLEILMGKYMDGQITPGENRMLQEALEADEEARALFEQLRILHQHCEEAVESEVLSRGKDFDEVFELAWRRRGLQVVRVVVPSGALKFVAGLAAGLLVGIGIQMVMSANRMNYVNPGPEYSAVAPRQASRTQFATPVPPGQPESMGGVRRNVDYYSFPDESGNEYLLERYSENVIKPAVHRRGI